jgi:HAD superfamily hydrolase (TIGR01450 family)
VLPQLILLDADGVLWRGGEVIPQAPGFIRRARAAGIRCVLITNNAGLNRNTYAAKCRRLDLALCEADIFSTNYICGPHLARKYPGKRILVFGSPQLVESVRGAGNAVTDAHAWLAERGLAGELFAPEQLDALDAAQFDVVLMGIDININYAAVALAGVCCRRGAQLVAANDDVTFPFEHGLTLPGNGSFVALVESIADVRAERLGKPEPYLLEQIALETGVEPARMLLIGDRIETDIELARRAGMPSWLVLTGVSTRETAPSETGQLRIADALDDIAAALGI